MQIHPIQRRILHADFYEVTMDELVTVEVPIHLTGKSEGVKVGGILDQVRREIQIQCLPGDIPKFIEVDVSALMIGDSIHVQDIQIEKAKILAETNFTIATVVPPVAEEKKVVEEEVVEAAAEAEVKEEAKEEGKIAECGRSSLDWGILGSAINGADTMLDSWCGPPFRNQMHPHLLQAFQTLYGTGRVNSQDVVLAKPLTFMNLSGEAVRKIVNAFAGEKKDLIVIHDDLDLPIGKLRIKQRGGDGGHQGVRSIIEALGGNAFLRLKIGIGRPPVGMEPADYVLRPLRNKTAPILI